MDYPIDYIVEDDEGCTTSTVTVNTKEEDEFFHRLDKEGIVHISDDYYYCPNCQHIMERNCSTYICPNCNLKKYAAELKDYSEIWRE